MKHILVLHGWMHSAAMYEQLHQDLLKDDCVVTIYEFPGFGNKQPKKYGNLIEEYANALGLFLYKYPYFDAIAAHGMGANILLRALYMINYPACKILLLNPVYGKLTRFKWLSHFNFGTIAHWVNYTQNHKWLAKLLCKRTVKKWSSITPELMSSVQSANMTIATETLLEMALFSWEVPKKLPYEMTILMGDKDKIITRTSVDLLSAALNCPIVYIRKCGHTPILDDYECVRDYIRYCLRM